MSGPSYPNNDDSAGPGHGRQSPVASIKIIIIPTSYDNDDCPFSAMIFVVVGGPDVINEGMLMLGEDGKDVGSGVRLIFFLLLHAKYTIKFNKFVNNRN